MFYKLRIRLKDTLLTNIVWSFAAKVFAMVFYFWGDVFYARHLGIDNLFCNQERQQKNNL